MAYTQIPLPQGVWVEVATGPALGLITPSLIGYVIVREEVFTPSPADSSGTPLTGPIGVDPKVGSVLYAKCVNSDSILHLDLEA